MAQSPILKVQVSKKNFFFEIQVDDAFIHDRDLDPQKQVVFRWDLDLTRVSCGITAISCVLCLRVGVLQQEELQLIPSVSHRTGIFLSCELSQILGIVSV